MEEHLLSLIRSWISTCAQSHVSCRVAVRNYRLPKRLLEVNFASGPYLRLINTEKTELSASCKYIALSHRWTPGPMPQWVTKKSNIQERYRLFSVDGVASTIRDAVQVARRLGVQYAWIDSLCIVQDSNTDWRQEASRMADIYSHAYFTISATGRPGEDDRHGLVHSREILEPMTYPLRDTLSGRKTIVYLRRNSSDGWRFNPKELFEQYVNKSCLASRGWIFQERVLSPRIVHFTECQVFWECNEIIIAEDGHIVQDECGIHEVSFSKVVYNNVLNGRLTKRHGLLYPPRWESLVEAYSRLQLTKPVDKLLALSGLASAFAKRHYNFTGESGYVAGLWGNDLITMLSWKTMITDPFALQPRPTQWRAPSFSWAAVDEPVSFEGSHAHMPFTRYQQNHSSDTSPTELVSCRIEHKDNDPFGVLKACTIVLSGLLAHGTSMGPFTEDLGDKQRGHFPIYDHEMHACGIMEPDCAESLVPGLQVAYLLLPKVDDKSEGRHFLVLVPLQTGRDEYDVYQRVGLGRGATSMFEGAEVVTISLV